MSSSTSSVGPRPLVAGNWKMNGLMAALDEAAKLGARHVHEVFRGETAWKGNVEVFDLTGHPKAKRCYGWSYGEPEQFITILEIPPVDSPESAVKVGVAYQIKKGKL